MLYADSSLTDEDVIDILNETPGMPTSRDFVEYTYYANGACATMTDQRGVVHAYTYDNWNRVTLDHITDLGDAAEGVDDAVRGIATAYDLLGRTAAITSYGDTNDDGILDVVRNQIQYAYDDYNATLNPDGWGRVATVWQENGGAVNTSTSPNVQYGYDSLGRLVSVTDPGGLELAYDYGAAGSIDNRLSRVAAVTNATGTLEYAAYTYLGAGVIVGSSRGLWSMARTTRRSNSRTARPRTATPGSTGSAAWWTSSGSSTALRSMIIPMATARQATGCGEKTWWPATRTRPCPSTNSTPMTNSRN